ncbi:uncharacterized protein LOC131293818 [Anopheles ziemanni]|uniref:uncharacterized protein LOC131264594 n=1 Tax=Anopheles coustani TaxID=139045 RepID=UPI00265AB197|nr:uncharacterized protein LOC131264594 [Anopheles coustani]XP_058177856.1 uncharacterized protein LOC131293818 [Anopheles ziemanni]
MDVLASIRSASDLVTITDNEEELVKVLQQAGLLATCMLCEKCGRFMTLKSTKRANSCKWVCIKTRSCPGNECTVRTGSIFNNSTLSLGQLMRVVFAWARNTKLEFAAADSGTSRKTAGKWYQILRKLSADHVFHHQNQIGGEGCVVELDESVVTKRKYHRGRMSYNNQVWVFGGICRETRDIFVEIVEKRDRATLHNLIVTHVRPGTTIMTDCWRSYNGLSLHGFIHQSINHSQYFIHPEDPTVHTQNIENVWRWLKPFLREKGTNRAGLMEYIREYEVKRRNDDTFLTILNIIKIAQS